MKTPQNKELLPKYQSHFYSDGIFRCIVFSCLRLFKDAFLPILFQIYMIIFDLRMEQ